MEQPRQFHAPMKANAGALSCPKLKPLLSMVMNMPDNHMTGKLLIRIEHRMKSKVSRACMKK